MIYLIGEMTQNVLLTRSFVLLLKQQSNLLFILSGSMLKVNEIV